MKYSKLVFVFLLAMGLMTGVAQAGLVASWTFDSGTTESVSSTAGTLIGDAAQTTTDSHDGSGGSLKIPDGGGLNSGLDPALTGATTMMAWIKIDVTMDEGAIVGEQLNDTAGARFMFIEVGELGGDIGFVGGYYETNAAITAGTWHHVAWSVDADGNSAMYLNGTWFGTFEDTFADDEDFSEDTEDPLVIGQGGWEDPDERQFIGFIDEVRIYDNFMCEGAIQEVMNGTGDGLSIECDGPVGGGPPPPPPEVEVTISVPTFLVLGDEVILAANFSDLGDGEVLDSGWEKDEEPVTEAKSLVAPAPGATVLVIDVLEVEDAGEYCFWAEGEGIAVEDCIVLDADTFLIANTTVPVGRYAGLALVIALMLSAGVYLVRRERLS